LAVSPNRVPYLRVVSDVDVFEAGDGALRGALLRREKWAAAAVWKRFAPRVFALLSQSLARPGNVEELTQEVLLRALGEAGRGRRERALPVLVYAEAAHVLEREFRRERRRRRLWRRPRTHTLELLGVVDRAERAALVRFYDVLDQLSCEERTTFVLHQFASLGEVDIADALDTSLPKIRKRLSRALFKVESLVDCDPMLAAYLSNEDPAERDLREGA